MAAHPELESEQAYITFAYECLERMRASARQLQHLTVTGAGGTHQARFERDVVEDRAMGRLSRLQIGTESLVFGRIDRVSRGDGQAEINGEPVPGNEGERFYIGRLPVSDVEQNPIVVDWRAPVAEAFYRATGRNPLGLERRRHFSTEADVLLGIDDEVFTVERLERDDGDGLVGSGALLAALGRARSGHMRDIVATIQSEQDEIIRAEPNGVIVVQGGPGTGKTAVALHRASYLLYTHRFPLERQGVLVVGPNRHFIRYISRVLPALGETGVDLSSIDDLAGEVTATGKESHPVARVKGDIRMAKVIRRAVMTRQRALREPLVVGFATVELVISPDDTSEMVSTVKRGHRLHNSSRKQLQSLLIERLYQRYRQAMARTGRTLPTEGVLLFEDFAPAVRRREDVKLALDRMWPVLTPQLLLRDLFGAAALIRVAAGDVLSEAEQKLLLRPRGASVDDVMWTSSDIPLLDEAAQLLGPVPKPATFGGGVSDPNAVREEGIRTYGHIIVDEAQDLSPMQLRMLSRRSLSGSMTIVGDIGQATGMWAPATWDEVLVHLPQKRAARKVELSVGYRTPAEIMALAAQVLKVAAPQLKVPTSVRSTGQPPTFLGAASPAELVALVARAVPDLQRSIGAGTIGVLCPDGLVDPVIEALQASNVLLDPTGTVADAVTVLPVGSTKGLEFDGVVVVEPSQVVREAAQGLRALYVALTRATRSLVIVHSEPLPACLSVQD